MALQQQQGMEWLAGVLAPEYLIGDSQGGGTSVEAALAELQERGVVCSSVGQSRGSTFYSFHVAGVFCRCAEDVARALGLQVGELISCQVSLLTRADNLLLRMLYSFNGLYPLNTCNHPSMHTAAPPQPSTRAAAGREALGAGSQAGSKV